MSDSLEKKPAPFAQAIERLRVEAGVTQEEAYDYLRKRGLEISLRAYQGYERGEREPRPKRKLELMNLLEDLRDAPDDARKTNGPDKSSSVTAPVEAHTFAIMEPTFVWKVGNTEIARFGIYIKVPADSIIIDSDVAAFDARGKVKGKFEVDSKTGS